MSLGQAPFTLPSVAPRVPPAYTFPDLEGLRDKLLAPRQLVRDSEGYLSHPDMPGADENIRYDDLLAVFGVEAAFVMMESDASVEMMERWHESQDADCTYWEPTPPAGENWTLLEIYMTEDCPCALYGRPMSDDVWPRRGGKPFDFYSHLARQAKFSRRAFGPGPRAHQLVETIRKELREIHAEPGNLAQWVSVALLALDGAGRTGANPDRIIAALAATQDKNEARQWPDWRSAGHGLQNETRDYTIASDADLLDAPLLETQVYLAARLRGLPNPIAWKAVRRATDEHGSTPCSTVDDLLVILLKVLPTDGAEAIAAEDQL